MAFPKADPERFGKIAKDPFSWMSERGTMFSGTHDLSDGVNVSKPKSEVTLEEFMCFGAWHAIHIWGDLNSFSGYDCVKFNFTPEGIAVIELDDEDECDPEEHNHEPYARCQCEGCCASHKQEASRFVIEGGKGRVFGSIVYQADILDTNNKDCNIATVHHEGLAEFITSSLNKHPEILDVEVQA